MSVCKRREKRSAWGCSQNMQKWHSIVVHHPWRLLIFLQKSTKTCKTLTLKVSKHPSFKMSVVCFRVIHWTLTNLNSSTDTLMKMCNLIPITLSHDSTTLCHWNTSPQVMMGLVTENLITFYSSPCLPCSHSAACLHEQTSSFLGAPSIKQTATTPDPACLVPSPQNMFWVKSTEVFKQWEELQHSSVLPPGKPQRLWITAQAFASMKCYEVRCVRAENYRPMTIHPHNGRYPDDLSPQCNDLREDSCWDKKNKRQQGSFCECMSRSFRKVFCSPKNQKIIKRCAQGITGSDSEERIGPVTKIWNHLIKYSVCLGLFP